MLVISTLKKLLCILRYPSFSSDLLGEYQVGVIQERIPGSIASQIFYPTASTRQQKNDFPYFRPEAVSALADFYNPKAQDSSDSKLLEFLSSRKHPCMVNAPPLFENESDGFPLVLFSHGLGGCMEMYTQLCQQIASTGMVVVALEHEDGSGCFAQTRNGRQIPYKRPDNSPYSREKVINFRRPFLQKRVQETLDVIDFFLGYVDSSRKGVQNPIFAKVIQSVDQLKGVALLGHSFGGASMALTTQQDSSSVKFLNSLTMLDPWAFSLADEVLSEGIPEISSLSILSETWVTDNPESQQVLELHSNIEAPSIFYAPNSVHASFSDAVNFSPGFVTKRIGLRGKKERRHETIRACAKACTKNILNSIRDSSDNGVSCEDINSDAPRAALGVDLLLPLKPLQAELEKRTTRDAVPVGE